MGKIQGLARMRGFAMTPPASEGYWARAWPPRFPEGPVLLEEKAVKLFTWHPF